MTIDRSGSTSAAGDYAAWLSAHRARLGEALRAGVRSEAAWSWARLAAFLFAIIIWYPLRHAPSLAIMGTCVAAAAFIVAVLGHGRVANRRAMLRTEFAVADESARRVGGAGEVIRWGGRPADRVIDDPPQPPVLPGGRVWLLSEQERDDLDLYAAPLGLFGLLNRTATHIGALRLRDDLEQLRLEPPRILARQTAVRWLAERHEQRLRLLAGLSGLRRLEDSLTAFARACADAHPVVSWAVAWAARLWSAGVLVVVIVAFSMTAAGAAQWALAAVLLLLLNIALLSPFWNRLRAWLARWEQARDFAEGYLAVVRQAAINLPLDDTELATLRAAMEAVARPNVLPAVTRWIGWAAGGGLMQILLNAVGLYHVHMLERIHRHVAPNSEALRAGMSALAELESLLSLACFAAEQPGVCWPEPVDGPPELAIVAGTHPLLGGGRSVPNDLTLSAAQNLWLITGSNMSGKSTFLRTAGVNILLAQAGAPACASSMRFTPARLMTDLRIRDNLGRGESYFLAEVRQVRRMILPPDDPAPVLGLVDEPFRGTNHQEQRAATLAIVEHLSRSRGLFLIATHDRTVAATLGGASENFHFQEELGDRELVFDYKLRQGPAVSRNALRVLEREGYPADLVARAHQHAQRNGSDEEGRGIA